MQTTEQRKQWPIRGAGHYRKHSGSSEHWRRVVYCNQIINDAAAMMACSCWVTILLVAFVGVAAGRSMCGNIQYCSYMAYIVQLGAYPEMSQCF